MPPHPRPARARSASRRECITEVATPWTVGSGRGRSGLHRGARPEHHDEEDWDDDSEAAPDASSAVGPDDLLILGTRRWELSADVGQPLLGLLAEPATARMSRAASSSTGLAGTDHARTLRPAQPRCSRHRSLVETACREGAGEREWRGRHSFLRLSATASRTRFCSACSSIESPSVISMARRTFPSRLALKRPVGSSREAPL